MAHRIPARLSPAEGRKFGFTVGTAFAVLAAISAWRGHHIPVYVLGGLAVALVAGAVLVPGQLGPVNKAWMDLAQLISKVTTPVFMGVVFFLVILPVGMLMRLFGRNPIKHAEINQSYWVTRQAARSGLTNQF